MASNRQTKYLAKYNRFYTICNMINNEEQNQKILLARAKKTLEEMPYFGINEYYNYSLILFQKSIGNDLFKFDYDSDDIQNKKNRSSLYLDKLNKKLYEKIAEVNKLDVELYEYALKIFFAKLKYFNII